MAAKAIAPITLKYSKLRNLIADKLRGRAKWWDRRRTVADALRQFIRSGC